MLLESQPSFPEHLLRQELESLWFARSLHESSKAIFLSQQMSRLLLISENTQEKKEGWGGEKGKSFQIVLFWLATKYNYRASTEDEVKITHAQSSPRPITLTASSARVWGKRQVALRAPHPRIHSVLVRPHFKQPWQGSTDILPSRFSLVIHGGTDHAFS